MRSTFKKLKVKVKGKAAQYPDIDISGLDQMTTLKEFDDTYQDLYMGSKTLKSFINIVILINF